jgi:hypothetical protein
MVLFQVVGMALQSFARSSLLNALPLCLALAAAVNWALPGREKTNVRPDAEDGGAQPARNDRSGSDGSSPQSRGFIASNNPVGSATDNIGPVSRRNSHNVRGRLPDPDAFDIGNDSELSSLRSDGSRSAHRGEALDRLGPIGAPGLPFHGSRTEVALLAFAKFALRNEGRPESPSVQKMRVSFEKLAREQYPAYLDNLHLTKRGFKKFFHKNRQVQLHNAAACLCEELPDCGCDDNTDQQYSPALIPDGSYATPNKNIDVSEVNSTHIAALIDALPDISNVLGQDDKAHHVRTSPQSMSVSYERRRLDIQVY